MPSCQLVFSWFYTAQLQFWNLIYWSWWNLAINYMCRETKYYHSTNAYHFGHCCVSLSKMHNVVSAHQFSSSSYSWTHCTYSSSMLLPSPGSVKQTVLVLEDKKLHCSVGTWNLHHHILWSDLLKIHWLNDLVLQGLKILEPDSLNLS